MLSFLTIMACGEDERITAFKKVQLVPMTAEQIVENQTVLVKGDRIFKIGPSTEIKIPPNARIIDGQGAFLMRRLENVRAEFSLTALAYNLRRAITLVGIPALIAAARP